MTIDIGSLCIECHLDTAFGSGRFVNRIPADNGEEDGWMCEACQTSDECFDCGKEPMFGDVRCEACDQIFAREMEDLCSEHSDRGSTCASPE